MKLTELLNAPYPFELKKMHGAWFASFETAGGSRVEVNLEGSQYGETEVDTVWGLEFVRDGDVMLTGTGDAPRILSTVVKFVQEFVDRMVPPAIVYASGKSEASRARVYRRLFERARGPDYVLLTADQLDTIKTPKLEVQIRRLLGHHTGSMEFFAMVHKDELTDALDESEKGKANVKYDVTHETARNFATTTDIFGKRFDFDAQLEQHEDGEVWDIAFAEIDPKADRLRYGMTGSDLGFRVIAFFGASLKEFIQRYAPLRISLSVEKEQGERARLKLYTRLMKANGYELIEEHGEIKIYGRK